MSSMPLRIGIGLGAVALGAVAARGLRDDATGGLPVDGFDATMRGDVPWGLDGGELTIVRRNDDGSVQAQFSSGSSLLNYEQPELIVGVEVTIDDWQGVAGDDTFSVQVLGEAVGSMDHVGPVPVHVSRVERRRELPTGRGEGGDLATIAALGGLAGLGLVTLATRKPMLGLGVVGIGAVAGGILGATLLPGR